MALTITNISKIYPNGVRALKNLSLTIGNNMSQRRGEKLVDAHHRHPAGS
jgi:hypothetical protein